MVGVSFLRQAAKLALAASSKRETISALSRERVRSIFRSGYALSDEQSESTQVGGVKNLHDYF